MIDVITQRNRQCAAVRSLRAQEFAFECPPDDDGYSDRLNAECERRTSEWLADGDNREQIMELILEDDKAASLVVQLITRVHDDYLKQIGRNDHMLEFPVVIRDAMHLIDTLGSRVCVLSDPLIKNEIEAQA